MNYLGEYQTGAPWTGTVDPAGGAIPSGTTWAPTAGASIDVSASDGVNAIRKTQKLMAGALAAGGNFMKTILIAVGAVALGGAAFWAYREYGHKLFGKGRKGGGARKRPRRRGRSKRG